MGRPPLLAFIAVLTPGRRQDKGGRTRYARIFFYISIYLLISITTDDAKRYPRWVFLRVRSRQLKMITHSHPPPPLQALHACYQPPRRANHERRSFSCHHHPMTLGQMPPLFESCLQRTMTTAAATPMEDDNYYSCTCSPRQHQ